MRRDARQPAHVVATYAVGADGRLVVRGFRAHCRRCGMLSSVFDNWFRARYQVDKHACAGTEAA